MAIHDTSKSKQEQMFDDQVLATLKEIRDQLHIMRMHLEVVTNDKFVSADKDEE